MKLVAFVGPSGVGKTTLLERLIPLLLCRGLTVAALKSSHHADFDRPGADSARLRRAGAAAVALRGSAGIALFGPGPTRAAELARLLPPVDLVLCEGFKSELLSKIEVHRRAVCGEFLCARDRRVFAVVTDGPAPPGKRVFGFEDLEPLAELLAARALAARPVRSRRSRPSPDAPVGGRPDMAGRHARRGGRQGPG